MIIDLAEIEGAALPFDVTIAAGELKFEGEDLRLTGDARGSGEIARHAGRVEVKGSITSPFETDCTRCLEPVGQNLAIDFAVSFVSPESFATGKEREVAADDLDIDILESDRIDLKDVVREQILLNIPEQVFCKPDCKGLCQKCGANRNLIDCKCNLDETDPRWEALKNLK